MPVIDENALTKKLKSPITDSVWLFYGDDSYLKEFYCNKIVEATVNEELKLFNFHTYNDSEKSLDDIFADGDNLPVMSDKTCLLVRNYPLCDLGETQLKDFEQKLKNLPDTTVLIFYYSTFELFDGKNVVSKWSKAVNILSSVGIAVNLSHRTRESIAKMLVSRAKTRGTSIDIAQALYLVDTVGEDMQNLLNEFNKVCSFSQGQPITKEMIDQTAVKSIEANVFDISTAILSGKIDRAFEITNELLRIKTPVQPIIGAMAGTFVNMYRYKTALASEHSVSDFADAFGYKGSSASYIFKNLAGYVRNTPSANIRKAIDILLETDVKTKSTAFDPQTLMSELTARLAQALSEGVKK